MKIREIKEKTNAELIVQLASMMVTSTHKLRDTDIKKSERICEELKKRGVINSSEELYKPWLEWYEG